MFAWFEVLSRNRREWVDATRRNNFEAGIRGSTVEKYADPAHFVYELLQNAEDQEATQVQFVLESDHLVFTHNGDPFRREDVEAITGIGNSDKPIQANKIGRFGLGFKSVFAVSDRPEVYSQLDTRRFAFAIEDLVVPVLLDVAEDSKGSETRFVLPFKSCDAAAIHRTILEKLSSLGDGVLLFLNHISVVKWESASGQGKYTCDRSDSSMRVLRTETGTGEAAESVESDFRIYSRDISVANADRLLNVRIAFRLNQQGQVIPEERPTKLFVYFETEETTGLHFRVHGPFLLTDNRANIKQKNRENVLLVGECTRLLIDAVNDLKQRSLLTSSTLAALPNGDDDLPDYFQPIRDAVFAAVKEHPLIPTQDGGYGRATQVAQGPQIVRDLLDGRSLSFLSTGAFIAWVVGVMRNSRSDQFLRAAGVKTWGLRDLAKAVNELFRISSVSDESEEWLSTRPDDWIQHLYALLLSPVQDADLSFLDLKRWQVVRLEDGTHSTGQRAYFPPEEGKDFLNLPRVKGDVLAGSNQSRRDNARKFLVELGVREIGEREELEVILKRHYCQPGAPLNVETHLEHVRRFVDWWNRHHDSQPFQNAYVFLGSDPVTLHRPSECCLDQPYCDSGLRLIHSQGISGLSKKAVWQGYRAFNDKGFVRFAIALGVQTQLKIISSRIPQSHPNYSELLTDYYGYRVRLTDSSINVDYDIQSLSEMLALQDPEISRRVWKAMVDSSYEVLQARFRPNQQYSIRSAPSSLVFKLRDSAWLPDRAGVFHRPRDLTRADLTPDFPVKESSGWLSAIGFGELERKRSERYQRRQEMASELGLPSELMDRLDELDQAGRVTFVKRITALLDQEDEPEFPERQSPNPTRRAAKLRERLASSPPKTREERPRTIRTSGQTNSQDAKAYLRDLYTNADAIMICQACHRPMPFQLDDGEYYFEAVELFTDAVNEHRENYLALCPTCAAMFKHACDVSSEQLRDLLLATSDLRVEVLLARKPTQIRFVEDHRIDLLALAEVEFHVSGDG